MVPNNKYSSSFQGNLYFQDSTGFPINYEEIKKCIDKRIESKGRDDYHKDIDILILGYQST